MSNTGRLIGNFLLLVAMQFGGTAFADEIDILTFTPPEIGSNASKAKVHIEFDYIKDNQLQKIDKDNAQAFRLQQVLPAQADSQAQPQHKEIPISDAKLIDFDDYSTPLNILFVFPNSKYPMEWNEFEDEDEYNREKNLYKANINDAIQAFYHPWRRNDNINAIYYAENAEFVSKNWVKFNDKNEFGDRYLSKVKPLTDSDVKLTSTFPLIQEAFSSLGNEGFNYVIFVQNGFDVSLDKHDDSQIQSFIAEMKSNHIKPIVIHLPYKEPDKDRYYEEEAQLKLLATDGLYIQAKASDLYLPEFIKAFDYINGHNVLELEIDATELEAGKHTLSLTYNNEVSAQLEVDWPWLTILKNRMMYFFFGLVFLGLIAVLVVVPKRKK